MENKNGNGKLNEIIRESMEIEDIPSKELNSLLKARIYQREAVMRQVAPTHSISIWFVPMTLNFITFLLFALLAILVIPNPYLAGLVASICGYMSIVGVLITVVGMKRANMKKVLAIRVQKRGALA